MTVTPACVHFEMRILPKQILNRHERAAIRRARGALGAAIVGRAPTARDEGFQLLD